jgi:hypothetical protein
MSRAVNPGSNYTALAESNKFFVLNASARFSATSLITVQSISRVWTSRESGYKWLFYSSPTHGILFNRHRAAALPTLTKLRYAF